MEKMKSLITREERKEAEDEGSADGAQRKGGRLVRGIECEKLSI